MTPLNPTAMPKLYEAAKNALDFAAPGRWIDGNDNVRSTHADLRAALTLAESPAPAEEGECDSHGFTGRVIPDIPSGEPVEIPCNGCRRCRPSPAPDAALVEAARKAKDLMEFHEGSGERNPGGHFVITINHGDMQSCLNRLRSALSAHDAKGGA